jgi:hypothetical protein
MPQSFKPIDLSRLKTYATGVIEKISLMLIVFCEKAISH